MRVKVTHDIDDLAHDCAAIVRQAPRELKASVREGCRVGATAARDNARRTAGAHGKHYPASITMEMHGASLFGGTYSGEYGPNPGKPQGGMSFEWGSRNQKPHMDLNRSADLIGPALAIDVRGKVGGWFW